ncbi:P-loop NTPase fold protein [Listeria seeligeri]|uniref:P-loop NTPase fold protein n=1 Tax=Listeria seeligeri TaxID=1640 RepID=UPI0031CCA15A
MTVVTNIEKIKKYIETDATTYALLLDGKWGSGKTYFLRNTLSKELSSSEFSMCYISLNGLSDLDELKKMVLFELMSDREKTVTKYTNLTGRMLEVTSSLHVGLRVGSNIAKEFSSMEKAIDRKKLENILFCFDDFERISDKLPVDEVLGFINSNFIEFDNIKVIIVADQTKLEGEQKSTFLKNKEKVIGRTLKQEFPDLPEMLDSFSDSFNQGTLIAKWLKPLEKRQEIKSVLEDFKIINLRQIRNVIGILNEILTELEEDLNNRDNKFLNKLISMLFNNLLVVYIDTEYGSKMNLEQYKFVLDRPYTISEVFKNMSREDRKMKEFYESYHNKNTYFDQNIFYFDFITDYVLYAEINSIAAEQELSECIKQHFKEADSIESTFRTLMNFQYLEMGIFEKLIDNLFELLPTEDSLEINQYFYLYNFFELRLPCKSMLPENWEDILLDNFKRRLSKTKASSDSLPDGIFSAEFGTKYEKMKNLFKEAESKRLGIELDSKIEGWFKSGYSNEENIFFGEAIKSTLFQRANSLGVVDKYVMRSNKNLISFKNALKKVYINIESNEDLLSQKLHVLEFKDSILKSKLINPDDYIQEYNIKEIVGFLDIISRNS